MTSTNTIRNTQFNIQLLKCNAWALCLCRRTTQLRLTSLTCHVTGDDWLLLFCNGLQVPCEWTIIINLLHLNCLDSNKIMLCLILVLNNICFKENVFPQVLKKAIVIRIYKKGNPNTSRNYKPISLLRLFPKSLRNAWLYELRIFTRHDL